MDKKTAEIKLEITRKQIGLLEDCLSHAKESRDNIHPRIYKAMIAGYSSMISELKEEEIRYSCITGK